MKKPAGTSFFAQIRQKFLRWRTNGEIFGLIFPHLEKEANYGYPFETDEEMRTRTEEFSSHALLNILERQISQMPKAYGESFRYIMHRDLHKRLRRYEKIARKYVQPKTCDPGHMATQA